MNRTVWIERINLNNPDMKRNFINTVQNGVLLDDELKSILRESIGEGYQEFVDGGKVRFWGKAKNYSKFSLPKKGDIIIFVKYDSGRYSPETYVGITSDTFTNEKFKEYLQKNFKTTWKTPERYSYIFLVKVRSERNRNLVSEIPELFDKGQLLPPRGSLSKVSLEEFSEETRKMIKEILGKLDNTPESSNGISSEHKENDSRGLLTSYLLTRGYYYDKFLISQFYTALKTKGFVILSGLTGTGKTKIVQELAELLDSSEGNFLFISVRPDWRDSKTLLGYYNPLTGKYHRTKLLDFILKARKDYERNGRNAVPYFLLLDEMNLAHVEYYFADFLSVLESGRDEGGFTREGIKLHDVDEVETFDGIPKELHLPPNLYILGTVNMDETTYSFSPKVLDRAFTIEFHDVNLDSYPPKDTGNVPPSELAKSLKGAILEDLRGRDGQFLARSKEEINNAVKKLKDTEYWEILIELNRTLEPYDLHFGYRVVDEIALFFQNAKESWEKEIIEFNDEDEIFDLAILMKVLPKFHGNRKKLEKPLRKVLELCIRENEQITVKFETSGREREIKLPDEIDKLNGDAIVVMLSNWKDGERGYGKYFRFKHTAKKVLRMLRQLYEIGFASFG